jgi:hypothetical protein
MAYHQGHTILVVKNSPRRGQIGFVVALPPGQVFDRESRIATLYFQKDDKGRPTGFQFSDSVTKSEVGTANAKSVPAVFGMEARGIGG